MTICLFIFCFFVFYRMMYDALSLTVNVSRLILLSFWTLENYWVNLYNVSSQRHLLDKMKKKLFYYMEFSITNFIVWLKTHWNITVKYYVYLLIYLFSKTH